MRFTRKKSIALAIGSVVLFFVIGVMALQSRRKSLPQRQLTDTVQVPESAEMPGQAQDGSRFTLNNFERAEIKDGRKVWEVKAAQGSYSPEAGYAVLKDATLWVYDKRGDVVELRAGAAKLFMQGTGLVKAEIYDGVTVVRNDELTVTTASAVFDKLANKVTATGEVEVESEQVSVRGVGLDADLQTRIVRLLSEVESVVQPQASRGKR